MSKLVWKGSTQLSPLPAVLVTCGNAEKTNVLTIAWTGIICSQPPRTYISVKPERFSHSLLCETGEFVINLTTEELCRAADYCGVRSGRDEDKLAAMHLETEPGETVSVPVLKASPLALECRVFERKQLGSHDMFLADITAIRVDEKYIDATGKLTLDDAKLIAYTHGEYRTLGKMLGTFGYTVRKKPLKKR